MSRKRIKSFMRSLSFNPYDDDYNKKQMETFQRTIPTPEQLNEFYFNVNQCNVNKVSRLLYNLHPSLTDQVPNFRMGEVQDRYQINQKWKLLNKSNQIIKRKLRKEIEKMEILFELERYCNGSLIYTAMHRSERCCKKKNKKSIIMIIDLLQRFGCRICNEYFDSGLVNNIICCKSQLTLKNGKDCLNTTDWDIPLCSKDGLLSNFRTFHSVSWIENGAQWQPFTWLVRLNTKTDRQLIDFIYNKWLDCNFKAIIDVDGNPWNLSKKIDDHPYYVSSYFGCFLERHSYSNWICYYQFLVESEFDIKLFLLNVIKASQKFRNKVVRTLELGTVDREDNECVWKQFVNHKLYDRSLVKYILEIAGVIPPKMIKSVMRRPVKSYSL